MADFETNRFSRAPADVTGAVDAGLRSYMLKVYNYMFLALMLTGATAYWLFNMSVVADAETGRLALTELGRTLYVSPLKYVLMFAPLGMVIFINMRFDRMSLGGAQASFWIFSGLNGAALSWIFLAYTGMSITQVFFITAAAFGGLSLVGYTTKRDLSGMGAFLIMGVWGLIIASVVNIFLRSDMMSWIVSVAGVGIFAGLTAYDTQKIKEIYFSGDGEVVTSKKAIIGALALYLDFINMFIFLLRLMGNRR